jgi:hypothetical protein
VICVESHLIIIIIILVLSQPISYGQFCKCSDKPQLKLLPVFLNGVQKLSGSNNSYAQKSSGASRILPQSAGSTHVVNCTRIHNGTQLHSRLPWERDRPLPLPPRRLCYRPTVFLHQQRLTAVSLPQVNIPSAFQKYY